MLVFVLNQAQKASTGKIQTPVYENVREFGLNTTNQGKLLINGNKCRKCFSRKPDKKLLSADKTGAPLGRPMSEKSNCR